MALLFALPANFRMKLIKFYAISLLLIAFATLAIMAKLWFVPFKFELNETSWETFIREYKYDQFSVDPQNGNSPNNNFNDESLLNKFDQSNSPNVEIGSMSQTKQILNPTIKYNYLLAFDRLQQTLGCCGFSSPDDWRSKSKIGLLAPSCCLKPIRHERKQEETQTIASPSKFTGSLFSLTASSLASVSTKLFGDDTESNAFMNVPVNTNNLFNELNSIDDDNFAYSSKAKYPNRSIETIFYCPKSSFEFGCKKLLSDRETRFLFNIRMTLLTLLAILFLNILAQTGLKFFPSKSLNDLMMIQINNNRIVSTRDINDGRLAHRNSSCHYGPSSPIQLPPAYQISESRTENQTWVSSSNLTQPNKGIDERFGCSRIVETINKQTIMEHNKNTITTSGHCHPLNQSDCVLNML